MKEALFYGPEANSVRCSLCNHRCLIPIGRRGLCGVRENQNGRLMSLVYGKLIAENVDPIEKKPLFHFQPGSLSYSIATVGCNFRCEFCQNWDISQRGKEGGEIVGRIASPKEVVDAAIENGCKSISYTYTEPTIFFEYAHDTSVLAVGRGLRNVFVSNGYTTTEALDMIKPYLHANNVDLKSFSDKFYRELCGARLEPVLETLKWHVRNKVWLEVTTLVVPGKNDSKEELRQIAEFIKNELADWVPWHVSRFYPHYRMNDKMPTQLNSIHDAYKIGKETGLKYVYTGNIQHENAENTYCPKCSELLVERYGFNVTKNRVKDSKCSKCSERIEGVWS
ncbi:MAG: AmmeMemoRadiSam system radical SAM enzyme [Candidatus Altiarchaeota archaeon]